MKNSIYALLIFAIFTGCKKSHFIPSIGPAGSGGTAAGGTGTVPGGPAIKFDNKDQIVTLSVTDKTLTMSYKEDVSLLVRKDSLTGSWTMMINEDFKASQLSNYSYTAITKYGTNVTNFVNNNLNDIKLNPQKDTLVNNIPSTKISFARTFLYTADFDTNEMAFSQYNALLKAKETIGFSIYINSNNGSSATYATRSNLVYVGNEGNNGQ